MTRSAPKRSSKTADDAAKASRKRAAKRDPEPPKRKLDIVEEAGKESFPASDAPPWTP